VFSLYITSISLAKISIPNLYAVLQVGSAHVAILHRKASVEDLLIRWSQHLSSFNLAMLHGKDSNHYSVPKRIFCLVNYF